MNTYTLLLIAAALAVAKSASIRGSSVQLQPAQQDRRHLMEESTCTLYQKCVTFDHPHPSMDPHIAPAHHEETWICELSKEDTERTGLQFVDIVETPAIAPTIKSATSGESTLTITEAIVDTESPRMFIPDNAHVHVENVERRGRSLTSSGPSTTGTLKALVVRLIDQNDNEPSLSAEKLAGDFFFDDLSLASQTKACSYNKLNIEPFVGMTPSSQEIKNGVVNVKMNRGPGEGYDQAAMTAANKVLGDLNDPMFDLVMFCFPEGTEGFVAFAYPNSKYSFYNDKWCGFVSAQMHEVGHNLGLGHSGEKGQGNYGDFTGMMGSALGNKDMSRCYNAQKSYQLGWYEDKVDTINPLDGTGTFDFVLNGVSDYERNNDALVVLRLEQTSMEEDYYIGFNRADSINKDTAEDMDMLTITRKDYGAPDRYGQSTKFASLYPQGVYVIHNFNNDRDVMIRFVSLDNGDAKIQVIDRNPQAPPPKPLPPSTLPCQSHTIEVNTDDYPEDNSWKIVSKNENGQDIVVNYSPKFEKKGELYETKVCLDVGRTYEFQFTDSHGDGLCCTYGRGHYRVLEDCTGNVIAESDTSDSGFKRKSHTIGNISMCQAEAINEPKQCANKMVGKWRWKGDTGKERGCKGLAKRGKCDFKTSTGEYVWELCQESCQRCD